MSFLRRVSKRHPDPKQAQQVRSNVKVMLCMCVCFFLIVRAQFIMDFYLVAKGEQGILSGGDEKAYSGNEDKTC